MMFLKLVTGEPRKGGSYLGGGTQTPIGPLHFAITFCWEMISTSFRNPIQNFSAVLYFNFPLSNSPLSPLFFLFQFQSLWFLDFFLAIMPTCPRWISVKSSARLGATPSGSGAILPILPPPSQLVGSAHLASPQPQRPGGGQTFGSPLPWAAEITVQIIPEGYYIYVYVNRDTHIYTETGCKGGVPSPLRQKVIGCRVNLVTCVFVHKFICTSPSIWVLWS